uniref:Superoxide dismutase [Cu-Zn] n=1 Tax=Pyrrhocoris apterus TaxID=37000 RepID=M4WIJ1_PYRAP|nr:Cu-Zn superoxide dismutase-like protein [Pyrrhocoris apterus]
MSGNITGLSAGAHGFHVHEFGDLSKGCDSLGNHFNPTFSHHPITEDPFRHVGDLGNLNADNDGKASIHEADHIISLTGPNSIVGRGLVIHSGKDDFGRGGDKESLRTGNSGTRVACGVIAWSLPPQLEAKGSPKDQPTESEAEAIEP